jgi:metallophosphoesterase (TIGR03767 family)
LTYGPGESHIRRLDLAPDAPESHGRKSLLSFVHVTDLHLQDHQSPGRFEFVDRFYGPAPLHLLAPAYRPQEFMQPHSCEAMIRTINTLDTSPVTGTPLGFVLCTGDLADNAQLNELEWAIRLFEGGPFMPRSGGPENQGVASTAWGDTSYWHPDTYDDDYKRRWGFPSYPGLIEQAYEGFMAEGIRLPWIACPGNHDALIQGTALITPAFEKIVTGGDKVWSLPPDFDILGHLGRYITEPESFLAGPTKPVPSDRQRRNFTRSEFIQRLLTAGGTPVGHGLSGLNAVERTTYYVDDSNPATRLIVLDTVNRGGNYHGSLGARQLGWLEARLTEVHSRHIDSFGRLVQTTAPDRLVVLCSHHGIDSLVNDMVTVGHETDLPRVLGPELEALLHRFPNVVLWVNGHTHRNTVAARRDDLGRTAGFWEVTTCSLFDWPCQARLVEVVSNNNGTLSIFGTMIDHAAPPDPESVDGLLRIAAVHRELAANDPHDGIAAGNHGRATDRNVELLIPEPFRL